VTGEFHRHTAGHTAPVDPLVITTTQEIDMNLETRMNEMAHQVAEQGTESARDHLEAIAARIAGRAPGAAAALIDWDGAEIMRARAFGRAARVVVNDLEEWERHALVDELTGTATLALVA
jgi:hypothetical protein